MRHLEADRYYVSCGGDEYLVELGAYEGNAWCGCMQFQTRHQPHLERGDQTIRRCKHIIKALTEYAQIEHKARISQREEE